MLKILPTQFDKLRRLFYIFDSGVMLIYLLQCRYMLNLPL